MSVELDEVYNFIASHEPFSHLPEETLAALPAQMGITYVRRGEVIVQPGQRNDTLHIIRSGAIDIVGQDNLLLDRREAGLNFGYSTLVGEPESRYHMVAVEDSVLYLLPRSAFEALLAEYPDLDRFFKPRPSACGWPQRKCRTPLLPMRCVHRWRSWWRAGSWSPASRTRPSRKPPKQWMSTRSLAL